MKQHGINVVSGRWNIIIRMCAASAILAAVLVFSAALVLHLYYQQGVYWDFITHYLYSEALTNGYFYKSLLGGTLPLAIQNQNHFYIEPFRAPLMSVVMAPFNLLPMQDAIPAYLAFEVVLLLIAAVYLARSLGISPLLVAPIAMVPYVMVYLTVLNGAEMLSMILAMFAVSFAARDKWQSGIFVALAALAKYSSLIFLLPLLFMPKGTRLKAFASAFLTTLPWLIFNLAVFGNPVYSYEYALNEVFVSSPPASTSIQTALFISLHTVFYDLVPFVALAALLALLVYAKRRKMPGKFDNRYRIAAAFCAVGLAAWFAFAVDGSIATLPRWGYIVYVGAVPLLSLLIYDLSASAGNAFAHGKQVHAVQYAAYFAVLLIFFTATYYAYVQMGSHPFGSFLGSRSQVLLEAVQQVHSHGLYSCGFVSNAWPYLQLYGIKAHNPHYLNSTMYKYPILLFDSFAGSGNQAAENNISMEYNYSGYTILIPSNHAC